MPSVIMLRLIYVKCHIKSFMLSVIMLNVTIKPIMLSATIKPIMLNVTIKSIMQSVIMLNIKMLNVVAPKISLYYLNLVNSPSCLM